MAVTVSYADLVRELFSVPDTKTIVMGVILCWPDPEAPVNHFDRQRGSLEEFVRWVK